MPGFVVVVVVVVVEPAVEFENDVVASLVVGNSDVVAIDVDKISSQSAVW